MSDDKIAEIRARHTSDTWRRYELKAQIHDDREMLLAEVERQRAEVERLREALEITANSARVLAAVPTAEEIDCLRAANKGLRAEVERLRAEVERLREALLWYADSRNHFPVEHRRPGDPDPAVIFVEEPPIMSDCGKRARNALEGKP